MSKIAQMVVAQTTPTVILASKNPEWIAKFAGKTLHQVGSQFDLDDDAVTFAFTGNPTGEPIENLCLQIGNDKVLVALSNKFNKEQKLNPDFLLKCEFRQNFMSLKDENGDPVYDDVTNEIQLDQTKPYMSFGNPNGITIVEEIAAFQGSATPGAKAGGTASKPAAQRGGRR